MKIGFLITARLKSERLPLKIIKDLNGGQVLIFAGPEERELSLEIKKKLGKSAILADGYSLGEAAAIIGKCQFFIAGDSGMGHIASTTKTNLILIFDLFY